MKKFLSCDILYETLWKKSLLSKIIYTLIPFVLIIIFGIILHFRDAFTMDEGYSFLSDYTNCYMLCYVFFFVYFVHGLFLPYFQRQIGLLENAVDESVHKKYSQNVQKAKFWISLFSIVLSFFAIPFIYCGDRAGIQHWYSKLNSVESAYYSFIIFLAWIMSARLFTTILLYAITTYEYLQKASKPFEFYNPDKKCGLKGLFNSLAAAMGFGVYFLIAVGMILYSDYNAFHSYGIQLAAYTYAWLIIVITIILVVIYYTALIVAYIILNRTMRDSVNKEIAKNEKTSHHTADYLRDLSSTASVGVNEFMIFILSVLFPGMAAIVQILSPLGK